MQPRKSESDQAWVEKRWECADCGDKVKIQISTGAARGRSKIWGWDAKIWKTKSGRQIWEIEFPRFQIWKIEFPRFQIWQILIFQISDFPDFGFSRSQSGNLENSISQIPRSGKLDFPDFVFQILSSRFRLPDFVFQILSSRFRLPGFLRSSRLLVYIVPCSHIVTSQK